ncbi:hypothetical protein EP7_003309 [Isosphaeraceae bacterium EP7]
MSHFGEAWIGLAALLAAGCAEELHPVVAHTAVVRGRITVDGRPVVGGWVEFVPVDGAVGHHRTAPIGLDGRYEATGVAVGRNLVAVSHSSANRVPVAPPITFGRVFGGFRSPLRRTIDPTSASTLDLELRAALREVPPDWSPNG